MLNRDAPNVIPELVRQHAVRNPDAVFCTFLANGAEEEITFGAFYRGGCAYAREFLRRGVAVGDVVPIILQHSPHLFYSFLGTMLTGAIPTFMPFPSAKQRADLYWRDHETLFARLCPRLIVTYAENLAAANALPGFSIETLLADDDLLDVTIDMEDRLPGLTGSPADVACLQHSSGTTGLKKGVMLTHMAILDQLAAYSQAIGLLPSDRIASWLPLYHDMGFIACFMMPIVTGTQLVSLDAFEWTLRPSILLDAIQRYAATLCWLPNFAFSHIVKTARPSAKYDLSSMRAFINCSEPCKPQTLRRFRDRFSESGLKAASLQVCYAMAENVFAVTQTDLNDTPTVIELDADMFSHDRVQVTGKGSGAQEVLSCGRLVSGTQGRICDSQGNASPPDTVGEIHITSEFLFSGYYLQPEITEKKLRNGWYATGDLGFFHAGELYVTGRVDDMIVLNGRNYYAHDIEDLVNSVAGVIPGRSIAIGIDDQASDATVLVVLVEHRGLPDEGIQLARSIKGEILAHLGLAAYSVVALRSGSLLKTTSGKISRVKNKDFYLQGAFQSIPVET